MATGSARARRDARGGPAGHGLGADGGGTGAERGRPRADGASGGTRRAAGDGTLRAPAGDGGRARRSPAAGGPAGAGGGPHSVVIGGRLPGAPRRTAARTAGEGRGGGEPAGTGGRGAGAPAAGDRAASHLDRAADARARARPSLRGDAASPRSGGADRRRHDGARDGAEETACPEGGPRAARRGREQAIRRFLYFTSA